MYIVKNYLTDETVAVVTREDDARAMCSSRLEGEPVLIYEEKLLEKNNNQGLTNTKS